MGSVRSIGASVPLRTTEVEPPDALPTDLRRTGERPDKKCDGCADRLPLLTKRPSGCARGGWESLGAG